jgi:hypothetical protein
MMGQHNSKECAAICLPSFANKCEANHTVCHRTRLLNPDSSTIAFFKLLNFKNGSKPMTDVTQALCFVLLVICLGACLIRAFWELESARQRRRERNQFVRNATRRVMPVTKRGV